MSQSQGNQSKTGKQTKKEEVKPDRYQVVHAFGTRHQGVNIRQGAIIENIETAEAKRMVENGVLFGPVKYREDDPVVCFAEFTARRLEMDELVAEEEKDQPGEKLRLHAKAKAEADKKFNEIWNGGKG